MLTIHTTRLRCAHGVHSCVLHGLRNEQRLFPCVEISDWFFSHYFAFPLSVPCTKCSIAIYSSPTLYRLCNWRQLLSNKLILIDKIYREHAKTVMFFLCTLQGLLGPSRYLDGRCTYHNWQPISALVRKGRGESYHPCHLDRQSFWNVRWLKDGVVTVHNLINLCRFISCFRS